MHIDLKRTNDTEAACWALSDEQCLPLCFGQVNKDGGKILGKLLLFLYYILNSIK